MDPGNEPVNDVLPCDNELLLAVRQKSIHADGSLERSVPALCACGRLWQVVPWLLRAERRSGLPYPPQKRPGEYDVHKSMNKPHFIGQVRLAVD